MNFLLKVICWFAIVYLLVTYCSAQNRNIIIDSHIEYDVPISEIWGYAAPDGKEYALVGVKGGISIVDVTEPKQAIEVARVNIKYASTSVFDIKTHGDFAYVVGDQLSELTIIDLSELPNNVTSKQWDGESAGLSGINAHNSFIDENGILYLFGTGGDYADLPMLDLTKDPWQPELVNKYRGPYVHDGFIRDGTMWLCEIYAGTLTAVDISDEQNPRKLGSVSTPAAFTHSCWPTDDGKVIFVADEESGASINAYDVSNVWNMRLLDRVYSKPGTKSIPHNLFVLGDYLLASYYTDGLIVYDIADPSNMTKMASYDTNDLEGKAFEGTWGVYPYLPSGTVLTTDMQTGLYVMQIDYMKACYVHVTVINQLTGKPIPAMEMQIIGDSKSYKSDNNGFIKGAIGFAGIHDIEFSRENYISSTITTELKHGEITEVTVEMLPIGAVTGIAEESNSRNIEVFPNPFTTTTTIEIDHPINNHQNYTLVIYDVQGRLISQQDINEQQVVIDGADWKAGIYFYQVKQQDGKIINSSKLIKE